jgi:isoamylase
VPMLTAGDEMGRTQQGNNNAYCQDNEISWVDWARSAEPRNETLTDYAATLIKLRAEHPIFRRRRFLNADAIAWFTPVGEQMTREDWGAAFAKSLTVVLDGDEITEPDRRGEPIRDDSFLVLINASEADLQFTIVPKPYGEQWEKVLDTAGPLENPEDMTPVKPGDKVSVISHSMQLFRRLDRG